MRKYSSDGRKCGIRGCRKRKPNIGEPGTYKVCFIDGHDLKWKVFTCEAQNRVEAISKMRETFGANFEHRVGEVFRVEDQEV